MNKVSLFALAMLLATCCLPHPLIAQNPPAKPSYKIEHQLLLPNGNGNNTPIRVKITRIPAVPLASDQHFHAMMHNGWRVDTAKTWSSATELTIPAGKTSAEAELVFSKRPNNNSTLLVEQGKTHTQSNGNDLLNNQIYRNQVTNPSSWLLISSNAPKKPGAQTDTASLPLTYNSRNSTTIPQGQFNGAFSGSKQIPGLKNIFGKNLTSQLNSNNWHALQPNELPKTWVGLSSISNVLISNTEFESLAQVPAYRKIMEQWVAAGGQLFVFNSDKDLSHTGSIFPLLLGKERASQARLWSPLKSITPDQQHSTPRIANWNHDPQPINKLVAANLGATSPYLNGRVTTLITPESLPSWLIEARLPRPDEIATSYAQNHSRQYSAIPGVGKPPIALFGLFTALFLFLIGPVILVIVTLNNNRRFLFFLVPVLSFLTCSSILGYAIVVDFNKQLGRTETITALDSRSGVAFTRASSAYYCGRQPSYYSYDTDTLIQTTTDRDSGYRIRQLPEENRLSSPRIQPRKIHEVFTAKPYPTQQRFRVTDAAKQPGTPEVTNLLGSRIDQATFKYQGKTYLIQDLAPKQTKLGVETPSIACNQSLRTAIKNHRISGGSILFNTNHARINSVINQSTHGEPHKFVAIIDTNPAVEPLIEPYNYKLQLHVVHGKYN